MARFQVSVALIFIVLTLVAVPVSAQQAVAAAAVLPFNIQINPVLIPVVTTLMAASPAFAAQCARIAAARYVRVMIVPVMSASTTSRGSARTMMRRFSSGALVAAVDMPVPLTAIEYAELFGHEFEHIIEQIDRVNLVAMSESRAGATRLADGAFETIRARRAGLIVAEQADRPRATLATLAAPTGTTPSPAEGQPCTSADTPMATTREPAPPQARTPAQVGTAAAAIKQQ